MKKLFIIGLCLVLVFSMMTACSSTEGPVETEADEEPVQEAEKPINVAMIHTLTGVGDQGMNDNSLKGLIKAKEELGITYTNVEPKQQTDFETMLMQFSNSGEYDLIFVVSADQRDALEKVAPLFPEQKYVAVGFSTDVVNAGGLDIKFEEYIFASGYLASRLTTTDALPGLNLDGEISVIYAMDIPPMIKAASGYIAGAKLANKDINVTTGVIGSWADVNKTKEIALAHIENNNVDIIQPFAGKAGLGVFNAIEEAGVYAFGLSTNQNSLAPDRIIASSLNKVWLQVFLDIQSLNDDEWVPENKYFGVDKDVMSLTFDESNITIPEEYIEETMDAVQLIKDGKLELPKSFEEIDAWVEANVE